VVTLEELGGIFTLEDKEINSGSEDSVADDREGQNSIATSWIKVEP
jgi:hypothetical protein